jgi:lactoylglutathione lyase
MADDEFVPAYWVWGTDARRPRLLHTMIRVRDIDASLRFYVDGLGMKLLNRYDFEQGRFSILFVGFGDYDEGGVIELTWNWDADGYTHGSGYGHVSVGAPDIHETVRRLEGVGADITVRPKPQAPGAPLLAFANDPDGYAVELIQTCRN